MEHFQILENISDGFTLNLIHEHWLNYPLLTDAVHAAIGCIVVIFGVIAMTSNGLILWIFMSYFVVLLFSESGLNLATYLIGYNLGDKHFYSQSKSGEVIIPQILYRSLRTSANLFVLSLAITDSILAVGNLPWLAVSSYAGYWMFGYAGCQVYGFVGGFAGFLSINTLTVIAIERCIVIAFKDPWRFRRTSNKTIFIAIVFVWIYSLMWALCPVLGWGSYILEGSLTSCTFDFFSRDSSSRSFVVSILVFCFFIQLCLICLSYLKIFMKVACHERDIKCPGHLNGVPLRFTKSKKGDKNKLKTAKVSLVIITVFCVSWSPYAIISIIGVFGNASLITPLTSTIPGLLAKLSTTLNPLIYALLHPKFRSKFPFQRKRSRQRKDIKLLMRSGSTIKKYTNSRSSRQSTPSNSEQDLGRTETFQCGCINTDTVAV